MKSLSLYIMSVGYVLAGLNHFIHPEFYEAIIPPYLLIPPITAITLINISGVCEMVFGLLLLPKQTRVAAAWLIIGLLIAIFPANIQMTINYWQSNHPDLWISIVRLPLQGVLIWWAWSVRKV